MTLQAHSSDGPHHATHNDMTEVPARMRVEMHGRPIEIRFTRAARKALSRLDGPLLVELELYFSCLVRKRVLFRSGGEETPDAELPELEVLPGLRLRLRAVVTEACAIDGLEGAPPVKTMPVARKAAVVPRWLCIHHDRHGWRGEFGFNPADQGETP